jgi:hypothetical protein
MCLSKRVASVYACNIVLNRELDMKHAITSLAIGAFLLLPSAGAVFGTGQPGTSNGVNCGGVTAGGLPTPGHSATSKGAPFNEPFPVGIGNGGTAGGNYAGSGANLNTPASPNAVSQYDVACLHNQSQVP